MFRSLRNRLILSHILPILLVVSFVGVGLAYLLETRVLLPRLAQNLVSDARLLSEISRNEYQLWGNPILFEIMLSRVRLDPSLQVMFLTPDGVLLYSSDIADEALLGSRLTLSGIDTARQGEEVALTNYSGLRLQDILIDVFSPVVRPDGPVIGIVRVTYHFESVYAMFWQMRLLILGVLVGGLLLGALVGLGLALSISRPVQRVTNAIYEVAQGTRRDPLPEQGPQELCEQARAVNHLSARLSGLEQARRQLLANLVHELGRPLGALRSAIHALSQGAAHDPQLLQDLTSGMDEETVRLQHVVEDLAHLHDRDVGMLELNRESISLSDWLPRTLSPWVQAAMEKKLHWDVEISADLPQVVADPLRLAQIIGNLTDNAIRYTPPGHSVTVAAGQEAGKVWVTVSDTGPGIAADEVEKIFTPFFRGGRTRRIKQGMGLGLSIARDLAEAHGWHITVSSALGKGSQFTLWIPLQSITNELV
jgi:two-component system sensor histidine kinase BaeS